MRDGKGGRGSWAVSMLDIFLGGFGMRGVGDEGRGRWYGVYETGGLCACI